MRIDLKKTLLVVGLAGLTAVPFIAMADGFSFNVQLGDDNEKHYRFRDRTVRRDPEMLRAAQALAEAKKHLWYVKHKYGRERTSAIQHINQALNDIRLAEEGRWRGRGQGRPDRR